MSTTSEPPLKPILQLTHCYAEKVPNGSLTLARFDTTHIEEVHKWVNIRQEDVPALRDWINEQWPKES